MCYLGRASCFISQNGWMTDCCKPSMHRKTATPFFFRCERFVFLLDWVGALAGSTLRPARGECRQPGPTCFCQRCGRNSLAERAVAARSVVPSVAKVQRDTDMAACFVFYSP